MEESGSPGEDTKNSSRETDKNEEFARSVRSYECTFCKRGFTTAQALGGHMNIHRKHRAPKINPNGYCPSSIEPLISSRVLADGHEGYESYRPFFANIQSYPQWHFGEDDDNQVRENNLTYSNNNNINNINSPTDSTSASTVTTTPSDLFRDTSLNLGIVTTQNEKEEDDDDNEEKISIGDFREDQKDVDLELRLGYDH